MTTWNPIYCIKPPLFFNTYQSKYEQNTNKSSDVGFLLLRSFFSLLFDGNIYIKVVNQHSYPSSAKKLLMWSGSKSGFIKKETVLFSMNFKNIYLNFFSWIIYFMISQSTSWIQLERGFCVLMKIPFTAYRVRH